MKTASISALLGMLAIVVPASMWIGALQEKVRQLEAEVGSCATKEAQQVQESWVKSWSDELSYRVRRLEER